MRRAVCLALAVLMLSFSSITLAEVPSGQLHYLWDIPFGCDLRTFIDTAYEKTGIGFEEGAVVIWPRKDQDIKVLGLPARISAFFSDGIYDSISIEFDTISRVESPSTSFSEVKKDILNRQFARIESVYESLVAKYGEATGGLFLAGSKEYGITTSDDLLQYNFPVIDGSPDFQALRLAAAAEKMTSIHLNFNNISLTADIMETGYVTSGVEANMDLIFWDEGNDYGFASDAINYTPQSYGDIDIGL